MPAARIARGWEAEQRRSFRLGLAPALLVLAAITLGPAFYLFITSLTPLTPVNPATAYDFSDPLGNYREILGTGEFWRSVWVQIELSVVGVSAQLAAGLGLALLLDRPSRFLEALRTGFLVPMVLPPIVVAIIWKVIYTPDISPLHHLLAWLGLPIHSLITNPATAIWAIAFADTWEWFPFTMLMLLAAFADGADRAAGSRPHRWRQCRATVLACAPALYPADAGGLRVVPADRQHQGVPA